MPIATRTSTQQKESHDAARASRRDAHDEVAPREPMPARPEPEQVAEPDPYDNLACTD